MKHTWKAALAVATVAMIGTAGAAKADLTLTGQTGLFLNPTGQIVQKGAPEISGNYIDNSDDGYKEKDYGINGAIQAMDKLELNAGYTHYKADYYDDSGNTWHVGAKYQILDQKEDKGFDLAAGADYARYKESGYDYSEKHYLLYVAATKAFETSKDRAPVQGTLGVRWDRASNDYDSNSKASVYAGVQVPVTRTGEVSLIGELGSKQVDDGQAIYAIGLRYHPKNTGLSLGVGYGRPWGYGHAIFAQVGYTFGK